MSISPELIKTLLSLQSALADHQHRLLISLHGDPDWANKITAIIDPTHQALHLGEVTLKGDQRNQLRRYLGQENSHIIYNTFNGFDPELFAAVSGTLRGGGIFFLISPSLDTWASLPDPEQERIAVYPYTPSDLQPYFIQRFITQIQQHDGCYMIHQHQPLNKPHYTPSPLTTSQTYSDEQRAMVEALTANDNHDPVVITADRGRGKSAALGMAAAAYLKQGKQVVITAPRLATLDILFKHAAQLLAPCELQRDQLSCADGTIQFIAPDQLAHYPVNADIVMVDEAAAIPSSVLAAILHAHRKVIFATTIHGYEGTGQGFKIRFKALLDRHYPLWKHYQLFTPVRWGNHDPLEDLLNETLLLNVERSLCDKPVDLQQLKTSIISSQSLSENEPMLRELFALLTDAHYRTTPLDLRHLLEGPNLRIFICQQHDTLVAAALVADEGGFDEELDREIYYGTRRPRGHLLPQTLCSQMSLLHASQLHYQRVIRIAVAPELQQRGMGSHLLQQIVNHATHSQVDMIGSSFGATADLLKFWNQNGFHTLRLGSQRSTSSGCHAVLMGKSLSTKGGKLLEQGQNHYQRQFPQQRSETLKDLEDEIIELLPQIHPQSDKLDADDLRLIALFSKGQQRYENVLGSLYRGAVEMSHKSSELSTKELALLQQKLIAHIPWDDCARICGLSGRKAVIEALKELFTQFIHDREAYRS